MKLLRSPGPTRLDKAFYIGLYIKAVDGVFELAGGILLLFLHPAQVDSHLKRLTLHSLDGDKDDFIFRHIAGYVHHLTGGTIRFAAIYLIVDALIKLILIHEIFNKRYWAYIALIVVLSVLVIYQSSRILQNHSLPLAGLTIFDLIVIYLSTKEYLRHRMRLKLEHPSS